VAFLVAQRVREKVRATARETKVRLDGTSDEPEATEMESPVVGFRLTANWPRFNKFFEARNTLLPLDAGGLSCRQAIEQSRPVEEAASQKSERPRIAEKLRRAKGRREMLWLSTTVGRCATGPPAYPTQRVGTPAGIGEKSSPLHG
jgi:hypothetical protein